MINRRECREILDVMRRYAGTISNGKPDFQWRTSPKSCRLTIPDTSSSPRPTVATITYYDDGIPRPFVVTFPWSDRDPDYSYAADNIDAAMDFAETAVTRQLRLLNKSTGYRYGYNEIAEEQMRRAAIQRNQRRR